MTAASDAESAADQPVESAQVPGATGVTEPPSTGGSAPPATSGSAPGGPVAVLVGVPGAGKTTVGEALAARLGVTFRDTDADIVASAGREIADIFVESGEPAFRELEVAAVATAVGDHRGVLALGGGAVLDARTRALLSDQPVVWLRVDVPAAAHRAGLSAPRPVLFGNLRGQLKALMEQRAPLYAEVATLVVDTDRLEPDAAVEAIVEALGLQERAR